VFHWLLSVTSGRLVAVVLALIGSVACAPSPSGERPSSERAPVVNGEPSEPGVEDAVLLLRTVVDERELVCSSSLVAPNLVLTARHCVSHLVEGLFSCTIRGELVEDGSGAGRLGVHLRAADLEFYGNELPREMPLARGERVLSTLSETICQNDLAFVVLDRPLELPLFPLRLAGGARRGELATMVGYGLDETQNETEPFDVTTQGRTRKSDLIVSEVGPDSLDDVVTTAPPRSIVVEEPSGCVGDSGGPLLAQRTNVVLGVYSLLNAESCLASDARHLFTHVPPFRALTDEAFLAAGAEPIAEPVPRALGESCEDASDCAGESCIELPDAGKRCSQACADDDCPEAFECDSEISDEPSCVPIRMDPGDPPDDSAGAGGSPEEPRVAPVVQRRSSGCALARSRAHEAGWLLLALLSACRLRAARRRVQRRPSRGSSGAVETGGCAGWVATAGRGRAEG
jgi:hypothetical protein